ncbi:MAG: DUF362 domain-containing protein [Candidatus Bathyarchaeota archaeon]|jgi:uncharacterized protein (DUF362 family)
MTDIVSITRAKQYNKAAIKKTIYEALDLLNYKPVKLPKNISIKANLCYYWDFSTGETTDPRVVSAVIDYIRERWNEKALITIVESDATAVRMKHAFKMLGYEELAAQKEVRLSNLSEESSKEIAVSSGGYDFTFQIPQTISNSDIFLSVPKPKYHATKISCALKNQFGCNPVRRKVLYHPRLNKVIVALNKIMKPDVILVDGIIVRGHLPHRLGLVLAGTNPLCTDFVVAQIMGFNPNEIRHIELAIKEKVGEVENISVVGESISDIRKDFPKISQPSKLNRITERLKLSLYNTYLKLMDDNPLY